MSFFQSLWHISELFRYWKNIWWNYYLKHTVILELGGSLTTTNLRAFMLVTILLFYLGQKPTPIFLPTISSSVFSSLLLLPLNKKFFKKNANCPILMSHTIDGTTTQCWQTRKWKNSFQVAFPLPERDVFKFFLECFPFGVTSSCYPLA